MTQSNKFDLFVENIVKKKMSSRARSIEASVRTLFLLVGQIGNEEL